MGAQARCFPGLGACACAICSLRRSASRSKSSGAAPSLPCPASVWRSAVDPISNTPQRRARGDLGCGARDLLLLLLPCALSPFLFFETSVFFSVGLKNGKVACTRREERNVVATRHLGIFIFIGAEERKEENRTPPSGLTLRGRPGCRAVSSASLPGRWTRPVPAWPSSFPVTWRAPPSSS